MEAKVGQNGFFSEFLGFLPRNCYALLVSHLCNQRLAEPYPFTLLCHTKLNIVHYPIVDR